ncbi:MAG: MFS transporter [Bifidobacteriaceae bacterium]|jgi:putative MFS transporter|nr:MFS transporter [Bifidobacteriaceae bacterium]
MDDFAHIDNAPVSRFHRKLLVACCGGPFLDGYILSLIGVALVGFRAEIPTTAAQTSLLGAASLIGIFFGALVFGALTDRLGREKMYALDLTVLVAACLLSAFVTAPWQLIALRFVLGLAIGADYPIATSLLAEFTPARRRGFMLGMTGFAWSAGAMSAFAVGYAVVAASGGHHLWRLMLASGAAVGVGVVLLRRGVPESPRWLASQGRADEARAVLRAVYGERAAARADFSAEPAPQRGMLEDMRALFRGGYGRRTAVCSTLYFAQITPQYALYTFGAVILAAAGISGDAAGTLGELLIAALFAAGNLPALRLIETWGRRPMTVYPFALMALALAGLAVWPGAPAWYVVAGFGAYALFSGGPSILEWTYTNELFPTEIRATAVGFAVAVSRVGAAAGTYLLPISVDAVGLSGTLWIAFAITAVAFFVCLAWAPETKGQSLAAAAGQTSRRTRLAGTAAAGAGRSRFTD